MSGIDWVWCPDEVVFQPSYSVHELQFGKAPHEYMSPFWVMQFTLTDQYEDERRAIEKAVAESGGVIPFNVFDPRTPLPKLRIGGDPALVPALTVNAVSKAGILTVTGEAGDQISYGDPLAFTHDGVRHYYKAKADLMLDGAAQTLPVFVRPRLNLTGLGVAAERVKPTARFNIDPNSVFGPTQGAFTPVSLQGVEFWGAL